MEALNKVSQTIEKFTNYLLMSLLALMSIVYFSAVFTRFVLNSGITWAEEFTRYCNVALVMFGSSIAARHRQHISVSALESNIKSSDTRKRLFLIQQIAFTVFFLVTSIVGFNFSTTAGHVSPTMRVPMSFVYGMVSLACLLIAFQSLVYILNLLKRKEEE